jgi:hypothetical protein
MVVFSVWQNIITLHSVPDLPIGSIGSSLGPQNLGGLRPRCIIFLTLLYWTFTLMLPNSSRRQFINMHIYNGKVNHVPAHMLMRLYPIDKSLVFIDVIHKTSLNNSVLLIPLTTVCLWYNYKVCNIDLLFYIIIKYKIVSIVVFSLWIDL